MRLYRVAGAAVIVAGTAIQGCVISKFWHAGDSLANYDSVNVMVAGAMVTTLIFLLGDRILSCLNRKAGAVPGGLKPP